TGGHRQGSSTVDLHAPKLILEGQIQERAPRCVRRVEDPEPHFERSCETLELQGESSSGEIERVTAHLDAMPGTDRRRCRLQDLRPAGEEREIQPTCSERFRPGGAKALGGPGPAAPAPVPPQPGLTPPRHP